ncbi:hypothetical protein J3459_006473 [Metarhizium acridum]|uniref:AT hook, DNA-binding motif protein n=1 Tax=Metarhizium acridum (strain CQMa 102) TaxID=655827 RepID=E9E136_METAQ|nr:uncharacterized protein MAC_03584 [Metarhizium acridum CQMa 102]EFY90338.1 hypothetical protein MAC_03584 [Metarhizium acridum CQMa 102]KAG8417694.1 hypothetical protein J3458_005181 [Metarhizium acridum]KAG8427673.1 hypothetical protein J3459_006473 [Metarhizium acridum]
MTPAVIGDSDGDESDVASSPRRGTPAVRLKASSPTAATHPSGSTDSTFFKSIYNEHRDAANQHMTDQIEEIAEVMDASSFDNGFQETRGTGIYDKSLWDVPSSPELAQPKSSKKHDGSLNARTKITRGLRRRLDDIGYVSQEDELPEMTAQSRKKRRVERDTGSDDLVSTAPIESDASFMMAPPVLTSQKQRHVSVHDGALGSATKPLEQRCVNVMSSGTATNINTPRSNDAVLSEATPEIRGSEPASPALPIPVSETKRGTAKERNRKESKRVVIDSDDESEVGDYLPREARHDSPDLEEMPKPVEKKKQRGRPRKTDTAAPKEKEKEKEKERGKDSETNGKKKRGRPKKSAAVLKLDSDDEVQEIAPAIPESAHTEPGIKPQPDAKATRIEKLGPDVAETESRAAVKPVTKETPGTPISDTKVDTGISAVQKTAGRTPSTSTGGLGRPLYRVGLSKNTRIAPLLKIIRK